MLPSTCRNHPGRKDQASKIWGLPAEPAVCVAEWSQWSQWRYMKTLDVTYISYFHIFPYVRTQRVNHVPVIPVCYSGPQRLLFAMLSGCCSKEGAGKRCWKGLANTMTWHVYTITKFSSPMTSNDELLLLEWRLGMCCTTKVSVDTSKILKIWVSRNNIHRSQFTVFHCVCVVMLFANPWKLNAPRWPLFLLVGCGKRPQRTRSPLTLPSTDRPRMEM